MTDNLHFSEHFLIEYQPDRLQLRLFSKSSRRSRIVAWAVLAVFSLRLLVLVVETGEGSPGWLLVNAIISIAVILGVARWLNRVKEGKELWTITPKEIQKQRWKGARKVNDEKWAYDDLKFGFHIIKSGLIDKKNGTPVFQADGKLLFASFSFHKEVLEEIKDQMKLEYGRWKESHG